MAIWSDYLRSDNEIIWDKLGMKDKLESEDSKLVDGMWILGGIEALSSVCKLLKEAITETK